MTENELKIRLKQFGLRVIRLVEAMPRTKIGEVLGRQVLRSGTSVGANYRAACRAKSTADFLAKLAIVEEEADETCYWLELIADAKLFSKERLSHILREANEVVAMVVASIRTARRRPVLRQTPSPRSKIQNPKSNGEAAATDLLASDPTGGRPNPKSKIQNPKSTEILARA